MSKLDRVFLNGDWTIDYLSDCPYTSVEEPSVNSSVLCPVPGYWEDMEQLFSSAPFYSRLRYNPNFIELRYPQFKYCPDLVLLNVIGCFVYSRSFELECVGENAVLYIGGAQNAVSAWVNGHYIGRHEGYSTPFSLNIPGEVLNVGENRIVLAVSNNRLAGYNGRPVSGLTSRAANDCTGGIYGDVEIRFYPDGLSDVWVTTSKDHKSFTVHTEGAIELSKRVTVKDGDRVRAEYVIPQGQSSVTVSAEGYELWSPSSPKLYFAEVKTEKQCITHRFGIRRFIAKGTRLYLNGEPYYFRGTCEHCYHPLTIHPTRDKNYYIAVIKKLKSLGFNSIRFHTYIPPYEYMEAADELGMLFEAETPNNTSFEEWKDVVRLCRRHACVNAYSTGNELQIDTDYDEHLKKCSALVHAETDALFSPMSAMRGVEYMLTDKDDRTSISLPVNDDEKAMGMETSFVYNPKRLGELNDICDIYNTYSQGLTSYSSTNGNYRILDTLNSVYGKPLLSHEICIQGTYIDLSLEERYNGARILRTEFMSSVREHLEDKGILDKAELYYKNSVKWQSMQRKYCFETTRRCDTFAGYDFLGDIDTHWHTFGYCVGMMNEFYEMKPGETVENVLRYNSETILLSDLPRCVNFKAGQEITVPILVSHFGKSLDTAKLTVKVCNGEDVLKCEEVIVKDVRKGTTPELYRLVYTLPNLTEPATLKIKVDLCGGELNAENEWDIYVFPQNERPSEETLSENNVVVNNGCEIGTLIELMNEGKTVVVFGTDPFPSSDVTYQLSVAGRTNGHLATVVEDSPLMKGFPHNGYCGKQFEYMLIRSKSAVLDIFTIPHKPLIDIASSYKNAHREAMLFEYSIGNGKLLVCTLRLTEKDPAACWLKNRILSYAVSNEFAPEQHLTVNDLRYICLGESVVSEGNVNQAMNKNDITM